MPTPPAYPPIRQAWYAVTILTLAYIFSFIDRQILSLLVVPIRRDLAISDTQMSLLMGISFALFYTLFGLPLGRLADSSSRRNLITLGVLTWSLFTAGCGLAATYPLLFLMRVGVGIGEAALSPPAYSLLSDYFPPRQRPLALSVYGLGIFIGSGLAMILGGIIVPYTASGGVITLPLVGLAVYPWQITFFVIGLPGLLIAALVRTVPEPIRQERQTTLPVSLAAIVAYIKSHRATFGCHHLATALITFAAYGINAWAPSFLMRTYGWSVAQAGLTFGVAVAVFSSLGILAGGWYCQSLARRGYRDAHFRVGLITAILALPSVILFPLMPTPELAMLFLIPCLFLQATMFGVAPAALQQVAPNEMRAQISAVYLFVINLIGLGAGPTVIALVTDRVFHDDLMLRYSILYVCAASWLLSALLWGVGLAPYRRTLDQLQSSPSPVLK